MFMLLSLLLLLFAFGPRVRRGWLTFAACFAGALLLGSAPVAANPVVDVTPMGTVGCYAKQDLIDLLKTHQPNNLGILPAVIAAGSMLKAKIAAGKCFSIKPGEAAVSAPEWQGIDFWGDVAVFATRSGRRFYSTADSWHYAGNVVRFAEPPQH